MPYTFLPVIVRWSINTTLEERQHEEVYGHSKEGLRAEEEKRRGDLEDPEEFFIVVVVDTLCTSNWEWDTTLTF